MSGIPTTTMTHTAHGRSGLLGLGLLCAVSAQLLGCGGSTSMPPDASLDGDAGPQVNDPNDPTTWQPPERPALPARPAWNPSYLDLGSPGWQTSTTPLCNLDTGAVDGFQIWADASGVYLWARVSNDPLTGGPAGDRPSGSALHFNDGTGWTEAFWSPPDTGDPSTLFGAITDLVADSTGSAYLGGFLCGLGKWDGDLVSCALSEFVSDLSVTDGGAVFALDGFSVHEWDGGAWTTPLMFPDTAGAGMPAKLWTDGTNTVVAGAHQYVATASPGDGIVDLSLSAPAGTYTAVWASSLTDIWLGNSDGQLVHYDGLSWTPIATGVNTACGFGGILEIWGDGTDVYFVAPTAFGRWTMGGVELLVDLSCDDGAAFADLSPSPGGAEIFLSLLDYSYVDYECGTVFAIYWDGMQFHQF